jgi:hypothetical protein
MIVLRMGHSSTNLSLSASLYFSVPSRSTYSMAYAHSSDLDQYIVMEMNYDEPYPDTREPPLKLTCRKIQLGTRSSVPLVSNSAMKSFRCSNISKVSSKSLSRALVVFKGDSDVSLSTKLVGMISYWTARCSIRWLRTINNSENRKRS